MPKLNFDGIIPAIAVPFNADFSIDEGDLKRFSQWLAGQPGIVALTTNGHTGEVFSLTPRERAEVTRITARAVEGKCPVISSVVCEGIKDAVEQAKWAKDAGATGLDIMPPHHWLRFGFLPEHCIDYFNAIGEATALPLIVHIYPAWTRGSYSSALLAQLAKKRVGIHHELGRNQQFLEIGRRFQFPPQPGFEFAAAVVVSEHVVGDEEQHSFVSGILAEQFYRLFQVGVGHIQDDLPYMLEGGF